MTDSADRMSNPLHETIDLVHQAAQGDMEAWRILDEGYRPILCTIVSSKLPANFRSRFDTEDIVQSGLMDAYRGIKSFEEQGKSFHSWLGRIVVNKLFERLRFHGRDLRDVERDCSPIGSAYLDFVPDEASDEDCIEVAFQHAFLLEKIELLPEDERNAVTLHSIQGLSHQEVADELGITLSRARRHCAKGLATLARCARDI